jgi:hypothetical protein
MKNAWFLLIMFSLIGVACSPPTSPAPTLTTGSMLSTPTWSDSPIPSGKFLFVEFWVQVARGKGCYRAYIDFPYYSFDSGTLHLPANLVKTATDLDTLKGFFGRGQRFSGEAGFGSYSELHVIPTIPYLDTVIPHSAFEQHPSVSILRANALGDIEVEIDDQTLLLHPGQNWQTLADNYLTLDCHIITTRRFINHGLLDKSQIKL